MCSASSDFVFLLDVVVQLRTGYLEQGLMVYDSKKLAFHYLRSRAFLLDIAALCPLDLLQFRFGAQPLLRCPRFLKVYRAVNFYYMVESRTVWPNLWRVINLIHILLILAHWFGCFYFLLSEAEGFQGDWVYPYRPGDYATLARKYLGSLYWSTLTLTTIGDLPTPETNAEQTSSVDGPRSLPRRGVKSRLLQFNTNQGYIFTIVSYLIGVFIFATIVGQVGNVITNRNANRLEFERLLDGAKTYMRHHKVPGGMKRRVLRWYDYSWSRGRIQGGGDINTALGLLPDKLKTELALHVNLSVLKKVTIFQECQPEFLRDLVLKMKAYIFTPGDSICRKGEVAREMFIIADGILEVISEHGKVLTTMKAGDFFGEIGILNLDGLNKRTADVRSVGYSELFSLSREDVLTAMKDYPEAQEILQSLGRKRLMEVKASARLPHHQPSHVGDSKGLVGKIKNEAKQGLRNALKKTKANRRSNESLEMQPLNTNKATLKRMSRVKSHDLSQDEEKRDVFQSSAETMVSPLGAGLPLLNRLRLLKEKQDNEERTKNLSPAISPTTSSIKSPPPISEDIEEPTLPLLQRIIKLKEKENQNVSKDKEEKCKREGSGKTISKMISGSQPTSPTPSTQPQVATRASFSGVLSRVTTRDGKKQTATKGTKFTFREKLRLHKDAKCEETAPMKVNDEQPSNKKLNFGDSMSHGAPHWNKLKKAAIGNLDPSITPSGDGVKEHPPPKSRPRLLITGNNKQYRSIDDLSPEYGGLPFVKKLKILNERQKLEELESVIKTRSFSLDIPDTQIVETESLTRSQSEGSAMHQEPTRSKQFLTTPITSSPLHSSTESNETPERRNLKSILKKLSEDPGLQTSPNVSCENVSKAKMPEKIDSTEFRKLMRAPTIEGYAARHSKLTKSVTFNRDTLQSPPGSAPAIPTSTNPFSIPPIPAVCSNGDLSGNAGMEEEKIKELDSKSVQLLNNKANQIRLLKATVSDEQNYFSEIILAIKQVMSAHLHEMQEKFHQRFERLEEEIKSKDQIINQLKAHIFDLERNTEDSFTDSIETVVSKETSWEEPSNLELEENSELPQRILSPRPLWSGRENVVLNLDSTTDTDSENDREMDSRRFTSSSSGNNWEIELLAAQIREKRSQSWDHGNSARSGPPKKLFLRGSSDDYGK